MADPLSARQQIVDKIKESSNILVTVSRDPSVDELSAALGLTLMLNKLKKHATAIMSGEVPAAIDFLDPEKTFEHTVDSLRDFIIALDKEKADHLRYKVDGDVVKIFITPYRVTITQDDLDFSQGDYNVELVLALAVKDESHLDEALAAHGKILHDATVATIDNEGEPSKLGSIDWRDTTASSVSEMLVSLSEAIKGDKTILDESSATALLTGIVASTDRFSNEKTSSKVMTMAAQLMAAGADQQLIAMKLEEAHEIGESASATSPVGASSAPLEEGVPSKTEEVVEEAAKDDGSLSISHEKQGNVDEVAEQVATEQAQEATMAAHDALTEAATEKSQDNSEDAARVAEQQLAQELQAAVAHPVSTEPLLGGTLNATSEQAAIDKSREEEADRNRTLLTHGEAGNVAVNNQPLSPPPFNATAAGVTESPSIDPFGGSVGVSTPVDGMLSDASTPPQVEPSLGTEGVPVGEPVVTGTLADLDASVRTQQDDPRAAVDAAFAAPPAVPSDAPVVADEPAPPFSFDTVSSPQPSPVEAAQAAATPLAELPPLPDMSTLPPLPPPPPVPGDFMAPANPFEPASLPEQPVPAPQFETVPPATDLGQFKIPGQS